MLQRIQSIFLLLAGAASLALFGVPFATTPQPVEGSMLFADAAYNVQDQVALMVLFGLGGVLALAAIFLFRNRLLQMRMSIFAIIANFIGVVLGVLFYMQNSQDVGERTINDGIGAYLPIVAIILAILAYRFINKDDKLVRSMDRLR